MSPASFSRHYGEVHAPLVAQNEGFKAYCNRYVQHHVLAETVQTHTGFVPYDGISEFRFDCLDDAMRAWQRPAYMSDLRKDELNFVWNPPSHRVLVDPIEIRSK
jgi:uncharacterized protein (TIGR02118 family)